MPAALCRTPGPGSDFCLRQSGRKEENIIDMDTVLQGLTVTIAGMALVFLALGLLVLAMVAMGRFLRPRSAPEKRPVGPEPVGVERAKVAAMAAAIAFAQTRVSHHPSDAWRVDSRSKGTSPWQAAHRARTLARQPGDALEGGTGP